MNEDVKQKLDTFFNNYPAHHFTQGESIITSGEVITHIYYMNTGLVRQRYITPEGEEITLHMFKPYAFFPIMIFLGKVENDYDYVAMQSMLLSKAPVQDVMTFLKANPDVLLDLTARLAQGINGLEKKITTILYADAHKKLISILIYFSESIGKKEEGGILIPLHLTHSDLSTWIGLPRETVSRHFKKLETANILSYKGKYILITDVDKLKEEQTKEK